MSDDVREYLAGMMKEFPDVHDCFKRHAAGGKRVLRLTDAAKERKMAKASAFLSAFDKEMADAGKG